MKAIFGKLYCWLRRPFEKEYEFFLLLFLVFGLVNSYGYLMFNTLEKALGVACHHFLLTYGLTMILSYLNGKLRVVYKTLIIVGMIIALIIDLVCVNAFHYTYTRDTVALVLGTNTTEISEMWNTYFDFSVLFKALATVVVAYLFYRFVFWLFRKKQVVMLKVSMVAFLLNIIEFLYVSHTWSAWNNISITRFFNIPDIASSPDLHQYLVHPKFEYTETQVPQNIVLIIGESFAKSHSSLYGYEKNTNPLLSALQKDSLLYVFTDIKSSASHTIEAFQSIMSTYRPSYGDSIKWYQCLTVPEVMRTCGYRCSWISNQNRYGVYDNVVTRYAELCDTTFFLREMLKDNEKSFYDGDLIPKIDEALVASKGSGKNFYVVHLMGSHPKFNRRYPRHFNRFSPSEYVADGDRQKREMSRYDNSILYNDSVVYEMIRRYSDDETIIFYFSDHGLDVCQTRPDYIGHAIRGNEHSELVSRAIPFMVYMSKEFQDKHPVLRDKIKSMRHIPFETQDMIYLLMDLIGVHMGQ